MRVIRMQALDIIHLVITINRSSEVSKWKNICSIHIRSNACRPVPSMHTLGGWRIGARNFKCFEHEAYIECTSETFHEIEIFRDT